MSSCWQSVGPLLGEPYTRQLDGKLRELRFWLADQMTRISYWIAPGRRIILLTTWTKTRMRETADVERLSSNAEMSGRATHCR